MENIPVQWLSLAILITNIGQLVVMWRGRRGNKEQTGGYGLDWKKCAIEDLRKYEGMKQGLKSIKNRIAALEEQAAEMRATDYAKEPVQGGTSHYEDRLISNIAERERLGYNFEAIAKLVGSMDAALATLSPKERRVLELFYMRHERKYIERLCSELGYEQAQIYRLKDSALRKLTIAMYGMIDL